MMMMINILRYRIIYKEWLNSTSLNGLVFETGLWVFQAAVRITEMPCRLQTDPDDKTYPKWFSHSVALKAFWISPRLFFIYLLLL